MKRGLSPRNVTGVLWVVLTILTPAITRPPSPSSPPSSSSPPSPSPASPVPSDGCLNATSPTSDKINQVTNKRNNDSKNVQILGAGFKLSNLQRVPGSEMPESTLPYPVFRSTTTSSSRGTTATTTTSSTTTTNRLGHFYRIPDQNLPDADEDNYFDYYYEEPDDSFTTLGQQQEAGDGHSPDGGHQAPPGLNRVAKLKLLKMPRRQPPEYMLELYDRFSKASTPVTRRTPQERAEDREKSSLGADIVRSFPNINKEEVDDDNVNGDGREVTDDNDDDNNKADDIGDNETSQQLPGRETRHHTLVFNITSLLVGEEVSHAELRLYTLVEQDRNTFVGDNREVRVYEGLGRATNPSQPPVASRHVYGRSGGWEAFDVTSVVQSWVQKGPRTFGDDGVHVLEVKIDSVFHELRGKGGAGRAGLAMDIDVDPEHNEGPLLVVFSRDTSWQLQRQRQLQEMISHEPSYDGDEAEQDTDSDDDFGLDFSETIAGDSDETTLSRQKSTRNRNSQPVLSNPTQRAPLFSKHLASELFGLPAALARAEAETEGEQVALSRVRRDKRRRNSCRRKTLYVDFQDINWHQWIIAPQGYMAFECEGRCYIPIGSHLSPTNHAIIQTLVHGVQPKRASRACCVPTKLEPISILYLDDNHVITYKYNYDDMVVAECGCR